MSYNYPLRRVIIFFLNKYPINQIIKTKTYLIMEYKVTMLYSNKHIEIYIDNKFSLGIEYNDKMLSINLLFLKIDLF